MLHNEYLLANIGFDAAENEPCEVRLLLQKCERRFGDDNNLCLQVNGEEPAEGSGVGLGDCNQGR